jgi:DNA-directed RNA polymerase specialized sigma24 family protein
VIDSEHASAARRAIQRIAEAERAAEAARVERDEAIVRMHRRDGWRAPQIARALDMSVTNVRQILRLADARDRA